MLCFLLQRRSSDSIGNFTSLLSWGFRKRRRHSLWCSVKMSILGNKAAMERTLGVFKQSFNLVRAFSASATPPATEAVASAASKKPKRKKKKNLFEVVQFLPNWGLGYQMAKSHWVGLSYQITKINLYKDGKHGKAWGIVYKDGLPAAEAPKKISGVHKRCWKYIPTKNTIESEPKVEAQAA